MHLCWANLKQKLKKTAMAKIHKLEFELEEYPPYLPNLVPSDFFLYPISMFGFETEIRSTILMD